MSSSAPFTKRKGPFGGRTVSRNPGVQRNHIGALKNIPVGATFKGRFEASEAGIHCPLVAGIHGNAADGAYSIVLSGGYEDDVDHGDFFTYTGAGGRNKQTGEQVADQQWERGNLALLISQRNQSPIRVLRGWSGGTVYSPSKEEGYRYDGLYQVIDAYRSRGTSGYRVCRFEMVRYPYNPNTRTPHGRRLIEEVKQSVVNARLGQGRDDPVERVVLTLDKEGDWLVVEEEMGYEDESERWGDEGDEGEGDVKPVVGASGESGSASAEEDGEEEEDGEDGEDGDRESKLEVKPEPVDVELRLEYVDEDVDMDADADADADVGRLRSSTPTPTPRVPANPYAEVEANESESSSESESGRGGSRDCSTSEDQLDCIDTDTDADAYAELLLAPRHDADLRCSTPRPLSRLASVPIPTPTPDVRGDPYDADADASASEYAAAFASDARRHPDSGESRRRGVGVRGGRVESCSAGEDDGDDANPSDDERELEYDVDADADGGTRVGPHAGSGEVSGDGDEVAENDMDASDTSPRAQGWSWSWTQRLRDLSADVLAHAYEDEGDQPAANALASARSGKRKRSDSLDSVDNGNTDEGYSTTRSRSSSGGR